MSPRPKRVRKVIHPPGFRGFKPFGCPDPMDNEIKLLLEEFEAIKLADYEKLSQAEAAEKMNVSRPTFSRIYESARNKIASAFMEAATIVIEGGNIETKEDWFHCVNCHTIFRIADFINQDSICPVCGNAGTEKINTPESVSISKNQHHDDARCICPKCEYSIQHVPGEPCRTKYCPHCHISLIRENSTHHKELKRKIRNNKNQ